MKIIAIAAMTANKIIAVDGQMPWNCPPDMKFFKGTTTGYPVIVGRQTFEDMGGQPLPNRYTILMTKQKDYAEGNYKLVHDVREAISAAYRYCELNDLDRCYVIGGEAVYNAFQIYLDEVILSTIRGDYLDNELLDMANSAGRGLKINYFPSNVCSNCKSLTVNEFSRYLYD